MLSPNANAVQDLPHHLVPLISTAPKTASSLCRRSSTRRVRYVRGFCFVRNHDSITSLKWAYSIFEENDTSFSRNTSLIFEIRRTVRVGRWPAILFCVSWALDGESVLSSLGVGRRVCLSRGSVMFVDELIDKFAEIGRLLVIVGNQKKPE